MQVLEIHDVGQEDVGMYTCLAVNGSGKASMSSELSIQGTYSELGPGLGFQGASYSYTAYLVSRNFPEAALLNQDELDHIDTPAPTP